MTIADATEANNGIYSVIVSNPLTSVDSVPAYLNVVPPTAPGTQLATLHAFGGGNDGKKPSRLALGRDGNLYGTTEFGGSQHAGSVFMVAANGLVTNLVAFGGTNGFGPCGGVVQGPDGNFYGTTQFGGTNELGNVFMMTPVRTNFFNNGNGNFGYYLGSTLSNVYSFTGGTDGNTPVASLIRGADGYLYGTTEFGGALGDGNVFKISTNGLITNIYSFTNGMDGGFPTNALMQAVDGNFYGVTENGGSQSVGSVFRLTPAGVFSTVYSFTGGTDGKFPNGPLVQGADGSLYGTTQHSSIGRFIFYGVLFKVTTNGAYTLLYTLNFNDGHYPSAGMILGSNSLFYGTAEFGGNGNNNGFVFSTTAGGTMTSLVNFDGFDDGANPETPVVQGADGDLYGTTSAGGQSGDGTVFRLDVGMPPPLTAPAWKNGNFTFTWIAPPGRMYQLQYVTNLNSTNWLNSGSPIVTSGGPVTASDPTGTDHQRFYRILVMP